MEEFFTDKELLRKSF